MSGNSKPDCRLIDRCTFATSKKNWDARSEASVPFPRASTTHDKQSLLPTARSTKYCRMVKTLKCRCRYDAMPDKDVQESNIHHLDSLGIQLEETSHERASNLRLSISQTADYPLLVTYKTMKRRNINGIVTIGFESETLIGAKNYSIVEKPIERPSQEIPGCR